MKKTWLVITRELHARWILAPAAIVIGAIVMTVIRSLDIGKGNAESILTGAWGGTLVVAMLVGLSLLGDELTNGRLSFYFTRPFTPSSIFVGKLVAGTIVSLAIQALVLAAVALGLPGIAWEGTDVSAAGIAMPVADIMLTTCVGVAAGMAAGIVLRSRGRYLVVDVASLVTIGVVAALVVAHVNHFAAVSDNASIALLQIATLIVAITAIGAATARALVHGRTDRDRAHATLSRTLWPILVPASMLVLAATFAMY